MKLYQLANLGEMYGEKALWWMVVSDDLEKEIAGPFKTRSAAEDAMNRIEKNGTAPF